ncbi:IS66 family insertion sequence element accessory protein TnpB [Bradyrhizobium sp. USDA 4516]
MVLPAQPVDFRKSVHTLSALVSEALRANPHCGDVFVFRSKRMDRVKLLAKARFCWPRIGHHRVQLNAAQWNSYRSQPISWPVPEFRCSRLSPTIDQQFGRRIRPMAYPLASSPDHRALSCARRCLVGFMFCELALLC